jgi:hypothetical protein
MAPINAMGSPKENIYALKNAQPDTSRIQSCKQESRAQHRHQQGWKKTVGSKLISKAKKKLFIDKEKSSKTPEIELKPGASELEMEKTKRGSSGKQKEAVS